MQITEVEPEKKIVITKVQFSCDIIDESIPKPLFQNYNSFLILTAPPRSGKSTWITNMLCKRGKCYNRKFDSIYIVSPSLKTAREDPYECIPESQKEKELTVDVLERFVDEVEGSGERVLLLLDDVVTDIRKTQCSCFYHTEANQDKRKMARGHKV